MIELRDAKDGNGYVVRIDFIDETGAATTPISAKWSLFDGNDQVVNSNTDVAITPASTIYIGLTDAETTATGNRLEDKRTLLVEGTYNSSLGVGVLPIKEELKFNIEDLKD